jgi:hypothetical protein
MSRNSRASKVEEQLLKDFLTVENIVRHTMEYIDGVVSTFHPLQTLWGGITVAELRKIPDFYGSPLIMKYFTDSVVLHTILTAREMNNRLSPDSADACYRYSQGNQHAAVKKLIEYFGEGRPPVSIERSKELNELYLAWERNSKHLQRVNQL